MAPRDGRGLTVRIGSDLGALSDDLAAQLATSSLSVLEPEVIVVPTPGIGKWLEARLSRRLGAGAAQDGVAANLEMLLSGTLVRRAAGVRASEGDPWSIGRTTVACLTILQAPDDPALARLVEDADGGHVRAARAAADLFDQLFLWRPDVVDEWLSGSAREPRSILLRRVAELIAVEPPHRALSASLTRLGEGDDTDLDLPARLFVFGGDSLPGGRTFVRTLDALGHVRDVSVHLVTPVVARFEELRGATATWTDASPARTRAAADATLHPLLASWGVSSAETAALLAQLPERPTTSVHVLADGDARTPSLLRAVQDAVRGDPKAPAPLDGSVTLHGCVGERRQVEAARDAVLHALSQDDTLAASDVVVLCGDLSSFAPHVEAVLGDPQGSPVLPYVLRDRAIASAVPLIAALEAVLSLLTGRFTRSAVLDVLRTPACARKFGFEEEDLDRIAEWTDRASIHWGLDGASRAHVGIPATFEAGTWRRALDRLLAGVALPGDVASEVLGLRAIDPGHNLERVGALCEALSVLETMDRRAATPTSLARWCKFVPDLADDLFATSREEASQLEQLQHLLGTIEDDAVGVELEIEFAEFRTLFVDRASQIRDQVVTGSGGVTVTSLAPLRNVPFRVVVLLGVDEASMDRSLGVDLAFGDPRVGDRDARADLRAALLGALLTAGDRLVVTFSERDLTTNDEVPLAAVLVELVEAVSDACAEDVHDVGATNGLVFHHPRHPHGDADLLTDERIGRPFTFDADALDRAADLRERTPWPATDRFVVTDAPHRDEVTTLDLVDFLVLPQREFLRKALGVRLPRGADPGDDEMPTELDALVRWHATDELVRAALVAGAVDEASFDAVVATWIGAPDHRLSDLPGVLEDRAAIAVAERARALAAKVAGAQGPSAHEEVRVDLALAAGRLTGAVRVYDHDTVVVWSASSDDLKVRLRSTIEVLALTVAYPDVAWRGRAIRMAGSKPQLTPFDPQGDSRELRQERARASLETLVGLWRRGMAEPIPLLPRATVKMHAACKEGVVAPSVLIAAGAAAWEPYGERGDGTEPAVRFCFNVPYEQLCELRALESDPDVGYDAGGSRVLTYSLAMLVGLQLLDPVSEVRAW
jgi:exodeoxyribonuclease V gamma subunit